jgi:hypothetical protein
MSGSTSAELPAGIATFDVAPLIGITTSSPVVAVTSGLVPFGPNVDALPLLALPTA